MNAPRRTKSSSRPRVGVKPPPSCQRHAYGVTGAVGGCPWFPRAVALELSAALPGEPGEGRAR